MKQGWCGARQAVAAEMSIECRGIGMEWSGVRNERRRQASYRRRNGKYNINICSIPAEFCIKLEVTLERI